MTNYPGPTKGSRAPGRRLARTAASAGLAIALGLGLTAPIAAPFISAKVAWAEPSGSEAAAVQARGRWTFDGEEPWANTTSGSNLTMTHSGGVKAQKSNVKALDGIIRFDSRDVDYDVKIPSVIDNRGDYTISLWIKADAGNEKTNILQLSGDAGRTILYQEPGGNYGTFIDGENNHTFARINPGRESWHHVTFVKNKDQRKATLYINGKVAGEKTWTQTLGEGASLDLIFGEHKNQTNVDTKRFQGNMDEICVFGGALTQEQVEAHYASYANVTAELETFAARQELTKLVEKAKALLQRDDGQEAYKRLAAAVKQAEDLGDAPSAEQIANAKAKIEEAIGDVFSLGITVNVDPTSSATRVIDKGIFGINHRYAFNGYGSFDSAKKEVKRDFAKLYDEANFGSIRYPGGTISNLFNWKETLDTISEDGTKQKRTNQIHGFYNNSGQNGIAPNFGVSEIATFADGHGSEIIYVYSLGRGDAHDAADLVEFLNAEVGTNPNGGTDWARVRAQNGHPEPYNVRYFEIGNEMNQGGRAGEGTTSQQYWTAFVNGKGALDAYIEGGTATFADEYAIKRGNWNQSASYSNGEPHQEFGMRYARVPMDQKAKGYADFTAIKKDGVRVTVNGVEWQRVDSLAAAGPNETVYELDWKTGYFTFGDGKHGKIPEQGQQVRVSYQVERDGFNAISKSMRDTMKQINEARAAKGATAGEIHVYSSFENDAFFTKMAAAGNNALYDGMAIHPYSFGPGDGFQGEAFYLEALRLGDNSVSHVRSMTEKMRAAGGADKVPVISEYGIFRSTNALVRSQAHALYIARQVMEFIELGSPYIQKHCLVDWYTPGADALGPTQQAVIQAVPGGGANTGTGEGLFTFFKTPSALTFELYNGTDEAPGFGTEILASSVDGVWAFDNGVGTYDVLTSRDAAGNLFFAVTNLDIEKRGAITLKLKNVDLTGRTLEVRSFSGEAYSTENTPAEPEKVAVTSKKFQADVPAPRVELDSHSFTIIKVLAEEQPGPEKPEPPTPEPPAPGPEKPEPPNPEPEQPGPEGLNPAPPAPGPEQEGPAGPKPPATKPGQGLSGSGGSADKGNLPTTGDPLSYLGILSGAGAIAAVAGLRIRRRL